MKNSNDTIGNRTRDLPACSAVPQPTAPPRAPTDRNEYQEYFVAAKGGQCIRLTTLPHSCADCLEILEPQPTGTVWAYIGSVSNKEVKKTEEMFDCP